MKQSHRAKINFGVLVLMLGFAPLALAQGQSAAQAAAASQGKPQAGDTTKNDDASSSQSSAHVAAKSTKPAGTEPQMQSQEAAPADSLGEAARKARAQKIAAPAAKVYTEDKIAGLSGHGVSVVGDANQAGDSSAAAENSYAAPNANGAAPAGKTEEQMWRDRARKIHNQMDQIDAQISKIEDEIQKYGAVSFDPTTGLQRNVIYVQDRNAQIKQLQTQKSGLQNQLDSLEEEGRKAGADSGWFR
jgi:hypothetical protein